MSSLLTGPADLCCTVCQGVLSACNLIPVKRRPKYVLAQPARSLKPLAVV